MSDDVSEARKHITSLQNLYNSPYPSGLHRQGTPPPPFPLSDPARAQWLDVIVALDDMEKRITELERKTAQ